MVHFVYEQRRDIFNGLDLGEQDGKNTLEIDIGFKRGHRFKDPEEEIECPVHDTVERRWRQLNFLSMNAI